MAEPKKSASTTGEAPRVDRLALTLDANTGEVLKFEAVDAAGQHRELSQSERLELAKARRGEAVEELIERSFEAGLACLVGGADGPEDETETEDEAGFRRLLLRPLIEKSVVARSLRRDALRQAIVRSLIRDVVGDLEPESESTKAPKAERSGP
jgi:hypothetical protein